MFLKLNKYTLLILLTLLGALLHFYNLNWGAPFYFHPDERNIASSVSQMQFPGKFNEGQFNPHFFAYGSLPIYSIFFSGILFGALSSPDNYYVKLNFEMAIGLGRIFSALFATALIPILFFIGKKIKDEKTGLIAAFLAATSVGFIQYAHFGTFEMWLTFFSVVLFWICISLPKKLTKQSVLILGVVTGILAAIKISHIVIIPLVLLILFVKEWHVKEKKFLPFFFRFISIILLFFISAFLVYYITNPFVFLDFGSFKNSMNYESSLALGTLPVFYTGEFFNTIPIIFQFTKIYPFLLNPLLTIIFIPSFYYLLTQIVKRKNIAFLILASFFMILFFSQAFLFAKWTRYMMPTLPFIFLIISIMISDVIARGETAKQSQKRLPRSLESFIMTIIIVVNFVFAFSYFITAFVRPDTRIAAYQFAQKIVPFEAPILSEVYDLGIVPFNDSFTNIVLFNFYDLDNNSPDWTKEKLTTQLASSDYFIVPSQRILKTRLSNKKQFPEAYNFYGHVLNKRNPQTLVALTSMPSYKQIYETPCDIFCKIIYLGDPVYRFEETANVFDRPTVMIFKKIQ
jgi:4-amino-4-deoxy-L-arabinose transferase-like glycosyltransferase